MVAAGGRFNFIERLISLGRGPFCIANPVEYKNPRISEKYIAYKHKGGRISDLQVCDVNNMMSDCKDFSPK